MKYSFASDSNCTFIALTWWKGWQKLCRTCK